MLRSVNLIYVLIVLFSGAPQTAQKSNLLANRSIIFFFVSLKSGGQGAATSMLEIICFTKIGVLVWRG
jgi:hypothetical protein